MFNLLLFDTKPPGTSFPVLKPALQCHVVGLERGEISKIGRKRGKGKRIGEKGNDVLFFSSKKIMLRVFKVKNIETRTHKCVSTASSRSREKIEFCYSLNKPAQV